MTGGKDKSASNSTAELSGLLGRGSLLEAAAAALVGIFCAYPVPRALRTGLRHWFQVREITLLVLFLTPCVNSNCTTQYARTHTHTHTHTRARSFVRSLDLLPLLTPANYGYAALLSALHRSYRSPQPPGVLERNAAALSAVEELEEATNSSSFDVVYGLCHMPGLEASLLREGYSFSSCEEPVPLRAFEGRGFPYGALALYAALGGADFAAYVQQAGAGEWTGVLGYWVRHGLLAFSLGRVLL